MTRLLLTLLLIAAPAWGSGNPWPGKGGADGSCDGSLETISVGVTACNKNTGDGFTSTSEVWIKPTRASADDENSLKVPLEAAFDYCYNNTPSHSDISYGGSSSLYHGCTINVDSDIWIIDSTIFLDTTVEKIGSHVTINGNGGVWALDIPTPDGSSTIAELSGAHATECDGPEDAGNHRRVTNPGTVELYENGTLTASTAAAGGVTITAIDDNTADCSQKYGKDTIRVTATSHGLRDQVATLGVGDLVQIDGVDGASAATFNGGEDGAGNGIYLVKHVIDANNFCVTTDTNGAALTAGTTGTAEPLDSLAWCNGAHWQAGYPGIYIGGAVTGEPVGDVTLKNVSFRFDTNMTDFRSVRQRALLLDADYSSAGTDGGFSNIHLQNISSIANTSIMGQVIVDIGGPANATGAYSGQGVWADVTNDFAGNSWTETLMIRNVAHVWATVFSQHGGGLTIGEGENTTLPSNVIVRGSLGGCGNGPCIDIPSGTSINIDDMELGSDINGPLSASGQQVDSGYILRVGDPNNASGVVLNSDNLRVKVQDDSDRDWYVGIAGPVLSWSWHGGKIQKGDGDDTGVGTGYFVKIDDGASIGQLNWRHIAESDTDAGAITQLFDLSAAPSITWLCPNCESTTSVPYYLVDSGADGITIDRCMANLPNSAGFDCDAGTADIARVMQTVGPGPSFLHGCTSINGAATTNGAGGETLTIQPLELDSVAGTAIGAAFSLDLSTRVVNIPLNRRFATYPGLAFEITATSGGGNENASFAWNCRVSTLVADTL